MLVFWWTVIRATISTSALIELTASMNLSIRPESMGKDFIIHLRAMTAFSVRLLSGVVTFIFGRLVHIISQAILAMTSILCV